MKIGFLGILSLLLAAGKIFGFLQIGWLWVLAPVLLGLVFNMFILVSIIIGMILVAINS